MIEFISMVAFIALPFVGLGAVFAYVEANAGPFAWISYGACYLGHKLGILKPDAALEMFVELSKLEDWNTTWNGFRRSNKSYETTEVNLEKGRIEIGGKEVKKFAKTGYYGTQMSRNLNRTAKMKKKIAQAEQDVKHIQMIKNHLENI